MKTAICTERLELIPATRQILESDSGDRTGLARLLNAGIPEAWPPPLMDENVIREFIRMSSDTTGPLFATWYWVLDDPASGNRVLIGNGGVLGAESGPDTVVLGYSVLDEFRNRGCATEAVRALVPEIFTLPGVRRIIATTYPDLGASIRVLEKNGFHKTGRAPAGTGAEEGSVCYVLEKS
ncbi:MAG: GNAT family N-acetyltransferase [Methanoregula sp.]|jgi:RimJ/RimL family protein N-acetyltransferase